MTIPTPTIAPTARAIDLAAPDHGTADPSLANAQRIAALLQNKAYKQGALRIHYKGVRTADGATSGLLLNGILPHGVDSGGASHPSTIELPGASAGARIEDLARTEAYAELFARFGDKVRMKSTVYLHEGGPHAGTVKASRHKLYFQNTQGQWEKKFDHLQDGARGPINRAEVLSLQHRIAALSPTSPTLPSIKKP
jgi:hypothetical protein